MLPSVLEPEEAAATPLPEQEIEALLLGAEPEPTTHGIEVVETGYVEEIEVASAAAAAPDVPELRLETTSESAEAHAERVVAHLLGR